MFNENASQPMLCVPCRFVGRSESWSRMGNINCPRCGEPLRRMHTSWRCPRKTNDKAWKRIEAGDYYWDKRAIAHKEALKKRLQDKVQERMRMKKRIKSMYDNNRV